MRPQLPDIEAYYNGTDFDYRAIWNRRRSEVAVHFGFYDDHARHHAAALDNMNRVLADWVGIAAGERVLDAGCGLGNACFWLARHRGAQVVGLNMVERQIADCQKRARQQQGLGISFVQGDFCKMPFQDQSFDVVWACESVCHTAEKAQFYMEAFRVLRPGGRLVMAEYMRTARPVSLASEQLLANWLRPWAIPDIDTMEEHRSHAASVGFREIEMVDATPNVRVSLRNLHSISRRWLPLGRLLHAVRWVSDVRLGNAQASVRQYEALLAGAWVYGLLRARKGYEEKS